MLINPDGNSTRVRRDLLFITRIHLWVYLPLSHKGWICGNQVKSAEISVEGLEKPNDEQRKIGEAGMNLYLDIDGVMLGKEDPNSPEIRLAHHAEEFLAFALALFDCFWLTTHCQGRTEEVLRHLAPYCSVDFLDLAAKVKPTCFQVMKTEALDGDFLWLDDAPLQCELDWLAAGAGWTGGSGWIRGMSRMIC